MILMLILAIIGFAIAVTAGILADEDEGWDNFFLTFIGLGFVFGLGWMLVQGIGQSKHTKTINITYPIKIVSLQDGSQVQGSLSGGLFVIRGTVNEKEYFSYYKNNGNNTYSLEKRPADQSVIIPDATPETAYVNVTDSYQACKATWWLSCYDQPATFTHADFHVPANSIKNDFTLDAK